MIVYTTCRRCGGLLHTTDNHTVHPLCEPVTRPVEQLAARWLHAVEAGDEFSADALEHDIEHIDNQPPQLLRAALLYASWGWPVFPLKPHTKTPATSHGFKDATTNTTQITTWWTNMPNANIGLPTGLAFDVIDIDTPDGVPALAAMTGQDLPVHGWAVTSSGGAHLYIPPAGRGCATRIMAGVDYRGELGYVVAPPSRRGTRGTAWSWLHPPSPAITGIGDAYGIQ